MTILLSHHLKALGIIQEYLYLFSNSNYSSGFESKITQDN